MRHYPDLSTRVSRIERLGRLFELHRQAALQGMVGDAPPLLLRDVERMFKARAIASFATEPPRAADTRAGL